MSEHRIAGDFVAVLSSRLAELGVSLVVCSEAKQRRRVARVMAKALRRIARNRAAAGDLARTYEVDVDGSLVPTLDALRVARTAERAFLRTRFLRWTLTRRSALTRAAAGAWLGATSARRMAECGTLLMIAGGPSRGSGLEVGRALLRAWLACAEAGLALEPVTVESDPQMVQLLHDVCGVQARTAPIVVARVGRALDPR